MTLIEGVWIVNMCRDVFRLKVTVVRARQFLPVGSQLRGEHILKAGTCNKQGTDTVDLRETEDSRTVKQALNILASLHRIRLVVFSTNSIRPYLLTGLQLGSCFNAHGHRHDI